VIGLFSSQGAAERALTGLREAGLDPRQISVIARDTRESQAVTRHAGMDQSDMAGREAGGVLGGAVLGGIGGGVLGWLVGISAWVIPGVGPLVGAGTLAATIGGAVAGAVGGGIGGALIDLGVPEQQAQNYEAGIKGGAILLAVSGPSDDIGRARDILERSGGQDIRTYGRAANGAAGAGQADDYARNRAGFQQHFTSRQAARTGGPQANRTWEQAEPFYRYGYDAARDERYRGHSFEEAEPGIRRAYETRYPDRKDWDQLREEIREGWNRARAS
jgi:hypothetical protein